MVLQLVMWKSKFRNFFSNSRFLIIKIHMQKVYIFSREARPSSLSLLKLKKKKVFFFLKTLSQDIWGKIFSVLILFPYSDILSKIRMSALLIVLSVLTCETPVFHTCEYLSTR